MIYLKSQVILMKSYVMQKLLIIYLSKVLMTIRLTGVWLNDMRQNCKIMQTDYMTGWQKMSDWLEEIKVRWGKKQLGSVNSEWTHKYSPLASEDMNRLISEVEQLRESVKFKNNIMKEARNLVAEELKPKIIKISELIEENKHLRVENEGLMKLKEITFKEAESVLDPDYFNALINNIAIEVKDLKFNTKESKYESINN